MITLSSALLITELGDLEDNPYKNLNATCIHTVHHLHAKCMQTSVCIQDNLILAQMYTYSCLQTVCKQLITYHCM